MKKIFSAICALLSVVSMFGTVACGGATETPDTPDTPPVQETPETPENPGESETPDTPAIPDTPVTPENPDTPDTPVVPEEPETPEMAALEITAPKGVVYPYVDAAKAFLEAGEGADVADYAVSGLKNPQVAIKMKWTFDAEGATAFLVEYATQADYSDAITVRMGASKRSMDLYNLYKGTKYYVRITAINSKSETLAVGTSEFETTNLGPRVMNVDGAYNVRDLGGFDTIFGKKIVQGIAYRGGMLHYNATGDNGNLTAAGKKTMSEELGIRAELDFRNESESYVTMEQGSSIPNATLTYITAGGFEDIFKLNGGAKPYRQIFAYLADVNNYPLYYHCTAGADRTGTVSYVLHALLGVSELECHQDFAFTSFSVYGVRGSQSGAGSNATRYFNMVNMLNDNYQGANLQEKTENYLLSIGVTAQEIANIKGIFFGEIEIPKANAQTANEAPVSAAKSATQLCVEAVKTWGAQKKEN